MEGKEKQERATGAAGGGEAAKPGAAAGLGLVGGVGFTGWGGRGKAGEIAVTSTSHLLTPQPCKDNSPRRLLTRLAEIQYPRLVN